MPAPSGLDQPFIRRCAQPLPAESNAALPALNSVEVRGGTAICGPFSISDRPSQRSVRMPAKETFSVNLTSLGAMTLTSTMSASTAAAGMMLQAGVQPSPALAGVEAPVETNVPSRAVSPAASVARRR